MRYVAFLRAINVGGHIVKMDRLRALFESVPLASVETFIASGNVIFDASVRGTGPLEKRIEGHLRASLGYEVRTFVRSIGQVAEIALREPFTARDVERAHNVYVAFLSSAPDAAAKRRVLALRNPVDDFHVEGSELYWLRRQPLGDSSGVSGAMIEKTLGLAATVRGLSTVRKLTAKYKER